MPDKKQIPFLIQLLDDASIRDSVMKELAAYGASLEREILALHLDVSEQQALLIRPLLTGEYASWLQSEWNHRRDEDNDKRRLEYALDVIAQFQFGRLYPKRLKMLLDNLADEFVARYTTRDALDLAEFLFQGYALQGVPQEEYYNPLNSNLVYVIEQRKGIPISLACVYILVGDRLGLKIEGCNFPGHFLAIANGKTLIDCFNGGLVIDREALASINAQVTLSDLLKLQCNTAAILARVLRNLITAYQQVGDDSTANAMGDLLYDVESKM
jgi:regulator of sirC expression with transglutaminase-like and TPR domain